MDGYNLSKSVAILVSILVFCTNMNYSTCSTSTNTYNTPKTTQFIKTSCNATEYPKLCFKSLSSYSSKIKTNYRKLVYTALSLSLTSAKNTSTVVSKLSKQSNLTKNELAAVKDCVENVRDSVDEIRQSLKELKNLNATEFDYKMSNIMTWVSAALSDDDSCLDGLDEKFVNLKTKKIIRGKIVVVWQMTSNALALVNSLDEKRL
ncbi:hypothetical protein ACHQM5_001287 [Ranunculus cassubicifolius]